MSCQLLAICFDANDPLRLGQFWAGVLGWVVMADPDGHRRRADAHSPLVICGLPAYRWGRGAVGA